MKTILLLGYDGYIGWALLQRLIKEGHKIVCVDDLHRRYNVDEMGSFSAVPIQSIEERDKWLKWQSTNVWTYHLDYVTDQKVFETLLFGNFNFDVVINLAHQPSGPFSQVSRDHAEYTLFNNYIGTNLILWLIKEYCPNAHYITIGSTGEYEHNLDIPIEEGYFTLPGASKESIFPRRTNSIYHASKIASTYLIDTLSRMWNIKCTDIQQAVVFGAYTDEIDKSKMYTRFDSDAAFGTVVNKFCLQSVLGQSLTIYGKGEHNRGFLTINDSIQALMIAINNDDINEFYGSDGFRPRVWNQLSFWLSINELAEKVKFIAKDSFGINVGVNHIDNPRHENTEKPKHYSYRTDVLKSYGYVESRTLDEEIEYVMNILLENKDNILELKCNAFNHIRFKGD